MLGSMAAEVCRGRDPEVSRPGRFRRFLVADVVGYSRLAGTDEDRTLARLRGLRGDLIDPAIAAHHGRNVKRTGDGSIIEFRSVVDALRCAIEVQTGIVERNAGVSPERRIELRIGVHLGDVVEESDGDLMGDGVNIAARLEGIAAQGGVCLSAAAYEQVRDKLKERFVDLGEKHLKNIERPCGSMLWITARKSRRSRRPPRSLTNQVRCASRWSFCRSQILEAVPSRSILSTGSRKA
jgi:class 3 adenylate cyclase